ncbi:MAG: S9 family peptidase [Phenylobacterium sp.]|uniref:alpha/beta hydrolase family protein n=1 Tax=Phenylobacterium sp. TaxID=1871053 RepID=UPI001B4470F0|nr:S9 family peptidase [Phenylobacterium sp.]MBP7815328.1 S9 family peptidase [Phenylobacterium sp.]MBP9231388.1 S9 family peptidase [Phenylobacterium sp.]
MFRWLMVALCAAVFALPAAAAPPIEAYGRLPTLEQVLVSPDGTKLAYVRPEGESRKIVIQNLADGKILAGVGVGAEKLRDLLWVGNDHIAFSTSTTARVRSNSSSIDFVGRGEIAQTRVYDLTTRTFQLVLDKTPNTGNFTSGVQVRMSEGKPMLYAIGLRFSGVESYQSLFRVDVMGGPTRLLDSGPSVGDISTQWILDGAGANIARTEYDSKDGDWRLLVRAGVKWYPVLQEKAPLDPPWFAGLGPEPDTLLLGRLEEGREVYRPLSLITGKLGEPLDLKTGVRGFIFDSVTHRAIGLVENDVGSTMTFFAPADQAAWGKITRAFPGERVTLESWSDDRKQMVVRVQGPKTGAAYMFVDLAAGRASIVDDMQAGLGPDQLATPKMITYKAGDGLDIPAVLTLPKGREPKNLPLVVLPHGGPESYDGLGFDWWSQALASRGYAVLQPNFRGSSGYGQAFTAAGYGEWGRKMQTDLSDGVKHLAGQGVIDPRRVCIVGASYGGYAALAGVALEPEVYRCAVSLAGLSDLHKMLVWLRSRMGGERNETTRYWRRFMGIEGRDESGLDAFSPALQVTKIKAPVLLIHGKDDLVVPFEQSQLMADALTAAGKPVELVTLAAEDHWLSRGATRTQMLQATVTFLEKANPPN